MVGLVGDFRVSDQPRADRKGRHAGLERELLDCKLFWSWRGSMTLLDYAFGGFHEGCFEWGRIPHDYKTRMLGEP